MTRIDAAVFGMLRLEVLSDEVETVDVVLPHLQSLSLQGIRGIDPGEAISVISSRWKPATNAASLSTVELGFKDEKLTPQVLKVVDRLREAGLDIEVPSQSDDDEG
jgi:hypothetical protein